jgi:hypothetical protein
MTIFETLLAVDDCGCVAHEYGNPCLCNDKDLADVEKALLSIADELRKDLRIEAVYLEWPFHLSVHIANVDDEEEGTIYFGFSNDEKGYGFMSWNNSNADKIGRFETQLTAEANADVLLGQMSAEKLFTKTENN